jgi:hypothetical protein
MQVTTTTNHQPQVQRNAQKQNRQKQIRSNAKQTNLMLCEGVIMICSKQANKQTSKASLVPSRASQLKGYETIQYKRQT